LLIEVFVGRPLVRKALLEYVAQHSPMLNRYVKGIARFTGLPEEEVRKSKPVREYLRKLLGL